MGQAYDHTQAAGNSLVRYFTLINIAIALTALGLWAYVGPWLADPLSAATQVQMQGGSRPDLANPTYAFLWLAPLAAIVLSQAAQTAALYRLARWIAAYPAIMIAFSLIWYFGFSADYR